jgi:LAO/AO transport system kinase
MDHKDVLKGNKRVMARVMSLIEDEEPRGLDILRKLHRHTGKAHIVGITGAPGVGKSTLVFKLAKFLRKRGKRIGIVAVDPTSPFTGGALLGDRIRMMEIATDPEIFIRSMGTRGWHGGLARKTYEVVKVLDAWGADTVLVETVGTGQAEVDVVQAVHTCIVMLVSGLGDEVQTFKAGILEIGDIFVLNKADRGGTDRLQLEMQAMLELSPKEHGWEPKIIRTVATEEKGIDELIDGMKEHFEFQKETGLLSRKLLDRASTEIEEIIRDRMISDFLTPRRRELIKKLSVKVADRDMDPYEAVDKVFSD